MSATALSTPALQGALVPAAVLATAAVAVGVVAGSCAAAGLARRGGAGARVVAALALPLLVLAVGALTGPDAAWSPLRRLPSPLAGSVALASLVALGAALAPWRTARPGEHGAAVDGGGATPRTVLAAGLARATIALLVAAAADGAAAGWGALAPAPPWSPGVAAALLDLSPRAFVLESGGVDWMRHESVYGPVGTDRLGPGIRSGWGGSVAPGLLLVVGSVAVVLRCGVRARTRLGHSHVDP
ncbi:MAG: hypothetical protein AAF957_26995 [Planctomycetota bacterium]